MGDKKPKSLVMKLFDDLIEDDSSKQKDGQKNSNPSPAVVKVDKASASSNDDTKDRTHQLDLDISEVVKVNDDTKELTKKANAGDDSTMRLSESKLSVQPKLTDRFAVQKKPVRPSIPEAPEVKASVGRYSPLKSGGFSSATEASLATSENLRIAQNRILELEQEIARLRADNEQLAAAGETMRRKADELLGQNASLEDKLQRNIENKNQEIELLRHSNSQKEKESSAIKLKIEELETRLSTNIQKIRVRERELENRLELAKMEGTALIRSKDEIILDLKRQLDQSNMELENYRNKGQELNRQISDKQEMLRRTVKALRIALSMLEGDEEAVPLKKVK